MARLLLLILVAAGTARAEDKGEYVPGTRKRTGTWTSTNDKGQVVFQSEWVDGKQTGLEIQYGDGTGRRVGQRIVAVERNYFMGRLHGTVTHFHADTGRPHVKTEYFYGKSQGSYESWYSDGKRAEQGQYSCGKPSGSWQLWYGDQATPKEYGVVPDCFFEIEKELLQFAFLMTALEVAEVEKECTCTMKEGALFRTCVDKEGKFCRRARMLFRCRNTVLGVRG